MRVQVSCIDKRQHYNPHERILAIGGRNPDGTRWKLSEAEAIRDIKLGKYSFYVSVNGRTVNVIIAVHEGREYLKTEADGYAPDNLLSLPDCPIR
jgi:Protein of unknown function (DUF3892)